MRGVVQVTHRTAYDAPMGHVNFYTGMLAGPEISARKD